MNESLRILQMLQAMLASQRAELFSEIQDQYCLIHGEELSGGECLACENEEVEVSTLYSPAEVVCDRCQTKIRPIDSRHSPIRTGRVCQECLDKDMTETEPAHWRE